MIYLVDDDVDSGFLLLKLFEKQFANQPIRHYTSGIFILEELAKQEERPKLILLDMHMPDASGIDTLTILKGHSEWKRIPVIMWSHEVHNMEIEHCYEAGANSYINKPLDVASMVKIIKSIYNYWFEVNIAPKN